MVLVLDPLCSVLGRLDPFWKAGSADIPAETMQFLFPFGCLPVVLVFLIRSRCKLEKSAKGIFFGISMGVLAGIGGLALFAAYRTGGSTPVITAATAAYPMITVILAMFLLHERLNWQQRVGLGFAAVSFAFSPQRRKEKCTFCPGSGQPRSYSSPGV